MTALTTPSTPAIWLQRFKRLAQLTASLTDDDPRFPIVMTLLHNCEAHYHTNNHELFVEAGKRIRALMESPISG
ncbi:MAG: hypothetical protein H8K06_13400 [Nitrospira sp.]|nr:hypothetical protein [Nitrospira sp.]